jgi:hypothetical protein
MLNFAKAILSGFEEQWGVRYDLRVAVDNRRHSQPRWLMIGQLSCHSLKNFPKLADFPLPAILAPPCRSNLGRGIEDDTCTYL